MGRNLRREYEEAMENAPDLVANETKFLDFLRTEDLDPSKAAKRLVLYWKYRKVIFEDRWLRPMTQTGTGTLSPADLVFLRTGYTVAIKRPVGGPICLIDMSRLHMYPPGHTNTRIVFYFATTMTDPGFQIEGVTIVHLVTSAPRPPTDFNPSGWKMFREALPLRVKQLVVAQAYEPWKESLLEFLSHQAATSAGFKTRHHPNRILGDSVASVLQKLETKGISDYCLPRSFGGTFEYSVFEENMRLKMSMEHFLSSAAFSRPSSVFAYPQQARQRQSNLRLILPQQTSETHQLQIEEFFRCEPNVYSASQNPDEANQDHQSVLRSSTTQAKKRRANVMKLDALRNETLHFSTLNARLREENRRMENLLAQARLLAAIHETSTNPNSNPVSNSQVASPE